MGNSPLKISYTIQTIWKIPCFPLPIYLSIPCAFKAIHSTGKIGKKCLQLFIYRQIGCNDNMVAEINRE